MTPTVKFTCIRSRSVDLTDDELDIILRDKAGDEEADVMSEFDNVWSDLNGGSEYIIEDENGKELWFKGY